MGDLQCSICTNEYTLTGKHIPRILPCHDTLCEYCIKRILEGAPSLRCPHCNGVFAAQRGHLTFQQNRYILQQLKKKPTLGKRDFCVKHKDTGVVLYCNVCAEAICTRCLSRCHREHDVVGLQDSKEQRCQTLYKNIHDVREVLRIMKEKYVSKERELNIRKTQTITDIRTQKEEFLKIFDGMIADVIEQHQKTTEKISEEIYSVDNSIARLNSIEGSTSSTMASFEEIKQRSSNVQQIKRAVFGSSSQTQKYRFLAYTVERHEIEEAKEHCGRLQGRLTKVNFSTSKNPNTQSIKGAHPTLPRKSAPADRLPNKNIPNCDGRVAECRSQVDGSRGSGCRSPSMMSKRKGREARGGSQGLMSRGREGDWGGGYPTM